MKKAIPAFAQREAPDSLDRETGATKVVVVSTSNNPKEGLNFKDKVQIALAVAQLALALAQLVLAVVGTI